MKGILFASVALAALLSTHQIVAAADRLPVPSYAPMVVAPIYNWTGCYVGANIGAAWGFTEGNGSFGTGTGFAGGGQIGCDYQVAQWVVGVRNTFDGTTISGGANWFDTLTARGGYLVQANVLLYAQAGAAWAQSTNATGWTVGGGVEWMFVPHWSAFLEYNYMDFGTASGSFGTARSDTQTVLLGLNYKF